MSQAALALSVSVPPPISSRQNIFGTGINVHCFGKGFPWLKQHYQNWGEGGRLLVPYLDAYGLTEAIVPDFRGMNAFVNTGSIQELVAMDLKPNRLWRSTMPVDGLMLQPKRSVFAISADCHTVLLVDTLHRKGLVLHCGRDALQPNRKSGGQRIGRSNIIDAAMDRLTPTNMQEMRALILCGIGPASFPNRADHDATGFHKTAVDYFVEKHGKGIVQGPVEEGHLNIPLIIRSQLAKWGVGKDDPRHVVEDGIDTFVDDRFYSRRQTEDGNNCVLVDMEKAFA